MKLTAEEIKMSRKLGVDPEHYRAQKEKNAQTIGNPTPIDPKESPAVQHGKPQPIFAPVRAVRATR